jgi:hypothetical protein
MAPCRRSARHIPGSNWSRPAATWATQAATTSASSAPWLPAPTSCWCSTTTRPARRTWSTACSTPRRGIPRPAFFCPRMLYMDDPQRVWFDGARWKSDALTFGFPGKDRLESELGSRRPRNRLCLRRRAVRACRGGAPGRRLRRPLLPGVGGVGLVLPRARAGWSSMVVPSARIWHKVGASFGSEASPLRTYFSARNKLVWLARHGSAGERFAPSAQPSTRRSRAGRCRRCGCIPTTKRLLWAWARLVAIGGGTWRARRLLARRQAIADFMRGRLGPPPPVVLELNARWAARRDGRAE